MQERKLVILGASIAGIALAQARRDALILEDGILLGSEFLASLNIRPDDGQPKTAAAEMLRADCRKADALDEQGCYYAPRIQAILAEKLVQTGVEIRFQAAIIDCTAQRGGQLIRWLDCEGMHALWAEKVVDTRPRGGQKGICVMLDHMAGAISPDAGCTVLKGRMADEWVLKWPLADECSWSQAREMIHERMESAKGASIAAVAPIFCYDYEAPIQEIGLSGYCSCISASYPHLFAAWEGGIACAAVL